MRFNQSLITNTAALALFVVGLVAVVTNGEYNDNGSSVVDVDVDVCYPGFISKEEIDETLRYATSTSTTSIELSGIYDSHNNNNEKVNYAIGTTTTTSSDFLVGSRLLRIAFIQRGGSVDTNIPK